jgi:hypothetical protein
MRPQGLQRLKLLSLLRARTAHCLRYSPFAQRVAFVPARRGGARIDPIVALRHE